MCPGARYASEECGSDRLGKNRFQLPKNKVLDCRCRDFESVLDLARANTIPVNVSAMKFCTAILGHMLSPEARQKSREATESLFKRVMMNTTAEERNNMLKDPNFGMKLFHEGSRQYLKDLGVTSELCREILTGFGKDQKTNGTLLADAARISEHHHPKGLGHLDPLVKGVRHHHLLKHVCKDECEAIVDMTFKENLHMRHATATGSTPLHQSCADRVVRKVEAEILGCCGRSCGWNNRSCMAWPFFTKSEKVRCPKVGTIWNHMEP